ncbi:MAG: beta galactosidase jelly roll domain-containing protein [Solirubrobacterales bacterium]|nr:beta galactosidase jelly roll domain-containing protein [Solirubrobacterales bacterium]
MTRAGWIGRAALAASLALGALVGLATMAGAARAQGTPDVATPPTKGSLYSDGQAGRYLLGGTWLYRADQSDVGLAQGWEDVASTDGFSPVSTPNAYNAGDFSQASMNGYVGWYRRDFTLPANAFARYVPNASRHWIVRFESVNYRATVWLNGHQIGTHTGAFLPFEFDLPAQWLHPRGANRLVIRVDDRRSPTDMPPGPGGIWWNFGGLLREVYLRAVQVADLQQVMVRPILPCPRCGAQVQEQVLVRNVTGSKQTVHLRGSYGKLRLDFGKATIPPHGTWTARATVRVAHPDLWAPGHPFLYSARLTLLDSRSRTIGGYFTYSGIRSIKVVGGQLELNGRKLNLRGVFIHEQGLNDGAAITVDQQAQLLNWARELGATVIRSHYPLGPEIEEMADRDGILIWSEVPVYQLSSQALAEPSVLSHAQAILQQNILTNQNHPSILLWSIGNELPSPVSGSEAHYISIAAALAHRLDPTRPVGLAISNWPGLGCQNGYGPLDVIGDNEYFGWFDAGGGGDDDRDALGPFLDSVRACYPHQAIMVTEFGFDSNRDGPVEERGTYAFQANSAAFHLNVFATKPWLSGAVYFDLQDYVAYPQYSGGDPRPDPPFNQKGLVDEAGNLKPAFAVVSQIYHATQQIGP